eukprot:TRINITY_DN68929_c0_g1_i2.p1 TRINITY_DN68929_c0_g1~~TRINITY_DN68929_c0_g1_i2.p1  ORF type:complete len:343 (-),score=23.91 TRINITY_DN68929_c0_g1_i2:175-1203(-)
MFRAQEDRSFLVPLFVLFVVLCKTAAVENVLLYEGAKDGMLAQQLPQQTCDRFCRFTPSMSGLLKTAFARLQCSAWERSIQAFHTVDFALNVFLESIPYKKSSEEREFFVFYESRSSGPGDLNLISLRSDADSFYLKQFGIDTSSMAVNQPTRLSNGMTVKLEPVYLDSQIPMTMTMSTDVTDADLGNKRVYEAAYILFVVSAGYNAKWEGGYGHSWKRLKDVDDFPSVTDDQFLYFGLLSSQDEQSEYDLTVMVQSVQPEKVDLRLNMLLYRRHAKLIYYSKSGQVLLSLDGGYDGCYTRQVMRTTADRDVQVYQFSATIQSPARPGLLLGKTNFWTEAGV